MKLIKIVVASIMLVGFRAVQASEGCQFSKEILSEELSEALYKRDAERVIHLLEHRADVNARDTRSGYTPLMMVCRSDYARGMHLLFEYNADHTGVDNLGLGLDFHIEQASRMNGLAAGVFTRERLQRCITAKMKQGKFFADLGMKPIEHIIIEYYVGPMQWGHKHDHIANFFEASEKNLRSLNSYSLSRIQEYIELPSPAALSFDARKNVDAPSLREIIAKADNEYEKIMGKDLSEAFPEEWEKLEEAMSN